MKTLLAATLALTLAACSGGDTGNAADANTAAAAHDAHGAPSANDSAATRGFRASMTNMMDDAPPYTGNADADFMRQMRVHHVAAVEMAEVQLAHGRDATARQLATDVIREQRREIALIDTWLGQHAGH